MYLTTSPIDLAALLLEARSSDGALCLFVGVVRDENEGRATTAIQYEAYGSMAESEMARIADGLAREYPAVKIGMKHRVGLLSVGDASVAIAAVSPHRADAFAACRAAIDRLKTTVPI
jgi:molybdopterin synthase catalytic subunit